MINPAAAYSFDSSVAGSSIEKPTLSMPFFFWPLSPLVLSRDVYLPIPSGRGIGFSWSRSIESY